MEAYASSSMAGEQMWALLLDRPGSFTEVAVPTPSPADAEHGEVIVRTMVGAICGSDLPYFSGTVSPHFDDSSPLSAAIPGYPLHEIVGEVVHSRDPELPVGAKAVGWATGTNAMAEFTRTRAEGLLRVPAGLDPGHAIVLQPLACVVDALQPYGDLSGRHVAVIGLGPFGLLFCHVARSLGARRVTGVDPLDRRDLADFFRIDHPVQTTSDRWAAGITDEDRPDLVIEAVGHQVRTLTNAVTAAANGAHIHCFGVPDESVYPFPLQLLFRKSLTISAGIVLERRDALRRAASYLDAHPKLAEALLTHTFPMSRAEEAFRLALTPRPGQVKVRLIVG